MIQLPPDNLENAPNRIIIKKGTIGYRITGSEYKTSLYYGRKGENRWDSPDGSFGVLYLAETFDCAFSETYGHNIADYNEPGAIKFVGEVALRERNIYRIWPGCDLSVIDLCGSGLATLSLDNSINTTRELDKTRAWSEALYQLDDKPDGIAYVSRHLPSNRAFALFHDQADNMMEENLGPVIDWRDEDTGRDVLDVLDDQGWSYV